jgi:hypothetical protein
VAYEIIEQISQIALVVVGPVVIWLLAQKKHWMRWGYIIGLCHQPFWFYTSIYNRQWGLIVLSSIYTACYLIGIYNYWIRNEVGE